MQKIATIFDDIHITDQQQQSQRQQSASAAGSRKQESALLSGDNSIESAQSLVQDQSDTATHQALETIQPN